MIISFRNFSIILCSTYVIMLAKLSDYLLSKIEWLYEGNQNNLIFSFNPPVHQKSSNNGLQQFLS